MASNVDAITNEENEEQGVDQPEPLKKSNLPTWERMNHSIGDDADLLRQINAKAEFGSKRGTSKLPPNIGEGRFPVSLIQPTIDGSLGDWKLTTPSYLLPYPPLDPKSGFTEEPILPTELNKYSFNPNNLRIQNQPVIEKINERKQSYNLFNDDAGKQFIHLLDYYSAEKGAEGALRKIPTGEYKGGEVIEASTKDVYLGSFIKTFDQNEDPTMLGYDIIMKSAVSPLFDGSVTRFINQFASYGNSEIAARADIYAKFIDQLGKFLKVDASTNSPKFNGGSGVKTYYMKKITGLSRLVDSSDSNELKQFVDYGKDFIVLTFNEDVTQNIGYLSSLYKALSYSRIHGKLIIPENLLRFDVDIEITEIRKYNRVFNDVTQNKFNFVKDQISKYVYTLYDCQFHFTGLPHGDTLDMSAPVHIDEHEIKFSYKWSSLNFKRFANELIQTGSASTSGRYWVTSFLDNKNLNPQFVGSDATNNARIENGSLKSESPTEDAKNTGGVGENGSKLPSGEQKGGDLEATKKAAETPKPQDKAIAANNEKKQSNQTDTTNANVEPVKGNPGPTRQIIEDASIKEARDNALKSGEGKILSPLEKLAREAKKAVVGELNSIILQQASLLNKTLNNLFNNTIGGIPPPKNVYSPSSRLGNRLGGLLQNFVGNSVKGFFTKP